MKPAGIIITYIDWSKWKQWWFNIPLLIFQLMFLIVGKAYGKIPDLHGRNTDFWGFGKIIALAFLAFFLYLTAGLIYTHEWLYAIPSFIMIYYSLWLFGGARWNDIWHAAQASHVRLCITGTGREWVWRYINFGYPEAKIDYWRMAQMDGKRFEYREPTFTFSQDRIDNMIQYAHAQVGKPYDELQLLSPALNFITWLFRPSLWGQEKIQWTNRPGGFEFCSSGVTACLRWAIKKVYTMWFFKGYDTAMVMPCMFVISEKWRTE